MLGEGWETDKIDTYVHGDVEKTKQGGGWVHQGKRLYSARGGLGRPHPEGSSDLCSRAVKGVREP